MLPKFKYHPEPIKNEVIEVSNEVCQCCETARGYIYTLPISSVEDVDNICPWCIADGSVSQKFDAELVSSYSLLDTDLSSEIIDELCQRTPSYLSWQEEVWLTCCNDACEFHGDASSKEIEQLDLNQIREIANSTGFLLEELEIIIKNYQPRGNPAFYKFICRHCHHIQYHVDCT